MIFFLPLSAQKPEEVYRKPLKDVLSEMERRYNIKLNCSENLVRNVNVLYSSWRYRVDAESALNNILLPLDLVWQKRGDNIYKISRFSYYQRIVEEGAKYLTMLLSLYPELKMWVARKNELRKCFFEQLKLAPFPGKTPLNPFATPLRNMISCLFSEKMVKCQLTL